MFFDILVLTRETRLYKDLKIDGDDAFELLKIYEKKFNVDMQDFNYVDYFAPEGIDLLGALKRLFGLEKKKLKEITLGDMEKAALIGRW